MTDVSERYGRLSDAFAAKAFFGRSTFEAAVDPPVGADDQAKLLAFLGRQP